MIKNNVLVFACRSVQRAEAVVKTLLADTYCVGEVSIIGRDYPYPVRNSKTTSRDEKQKRLLEIRAFWCRMWRLVEGAAFLKLAGIGSVTVAGPLAESMVTEGTRTRVFANGSPLRAAMRTIGIPSVRLSRIESVVRRGGLLVIATGDQAETMAAKEGLKPYRQDQLIHNEV